MECYILFCVLVLNRAIYSSKYNKILKQVEKWKGGGILKPLNSSAKLSNLCTLSFSSHTSHNVAVGVFTGRGLQGADQLEKDYVVLHPARC